MTELTDKAGEAYWTKVWGETPLSEKIDVHSSQTKDHFYHRFHAFYRELFKNVDTQGMTLLEIGCGNSVFMTYFIEEFGFQFTGLDYSKLGCEQSERILKRDGVEGKIYCGDAFNPAPELVGKFDVVCSFGVVEHFTDTAKTLEAFSQFVKPGGLLITGIPNMVGVSGALQKILNRPVYDIHVPMDKEQLEAALTTAGLQIVASKYYLSIAFGLVMEGLNGETISMYAAKQFFTKCLRWLTRIIWRIEQQFNFSFPEGKLFSAGIVAVARKK